MKTIYYLDDDWRYAKSCQLELGISCFRRQTGLGVSDEFRPKAAFIAAVNAVKSSQASSHPDAFILDVMVQYAALNKDDQNEDIDLPPYDRAGIRCAGLALDAYPLVPVVAIYYPRQRGFA